MVTYTCELCDYVTQYKSNFKKHASTKKHRLKLLKTHKLSSDNGVMNTNEHKMNTNEHKMNTNEHKVSKSIKKSIFCEFCNKSFNTPASKRRHEKYYCRENPDFIEKIITSKNTKIISLEKDKEELKKTNEKLESEKKELYKQVSTLLEKVGNTTNIHNNIILNNYGNEDLSHLTDKIKTEFIKLPYCAIPKMIEAIHFNDEKPENKNIVLPNKKENLIKVFEGDKWIYKNKNDTITDLVDSKYSIIDDHYEVMDTNETLSPKIKTTFTKFKNYYDKGDVELVENLKRECELVLLNNR